MVRFTKKTATSLIRHGLKSDLTYKDRFSPGAVTHAWLNVNDMGIDYDERERLYKNMKKWGWIALAGSYYVLTQDGYAAI
ncbi:hypothetical protein [Leptospira alexanderi]|uniref:hypothetical protein n=1 Tax=Leptospira alexanderi TaxID=100053 RepID=UPI000990C176|nr:hypothetical protein [Leptospira alexanderi]